MAYYPRVRARSMEARIRGWPDPGAQAQKGGSARGAASAAAPAEPRLLAHAGFKAGCIQLVTIDDREHTPNAGRQLVTSATVIATPPAFVLGIRGYTRDSGGRHAAFDVYAKDIPKDYSKYLPRHVAVPPKRDDSDGGGGAGGGGGGGSKLERAEAMLGGVEDVVAVLAVSPRTAGLEQKRPYVFESAVGGGDAASKFRYLAEVLGRHVRVGDVFEAGAGVDVAAITKGKGWQGVVQRMGAKRKQHKSRKTVREIGSLGPISPQYVMYTVPRAGQMGFHQRVEYNKRIMVVGNADREREAAEKAAAEARAADEAARAADEAARAADEARAASGPPPASGGKRGRGRGGRRIRRRSAAASAAAAAAAEAARTAINPAGGYKHFGIVRGDYVVLRGSVPGTYRRLVKMRAQIRNAPKKAARPNILEVVA